MERKSVELDAKQKEMKKLEGTQRGGTNVLILIFSFGMLFLTTWLHQQGEIGFDAVLLCTILMMSSFGPVVALSSLSNNLMQTLASGERVLSLWKKNRRLKKYPVRQPQNLQISIVKTLILLMKKNRFKRLFDLDFERQPDWNPWKKRFRKINAVKAADAFL